MRSSGVWLGQRCARLRGICACVAKQSAYTAGSHCVDRAMSFSDPLLTKAEVAELLRCCGRTIERQVRDGAFPPPQSFGKESLWFQSVIHAWLAQRRDEQMRFVAGTTQSPSSTSHGQALATVSAPVKHGRGPVEEQITGPAAAANASRASRAKPRPNVESAFSAQQLGHARR